MIRLNCFLQVGDGRFQEALSAARSLVAASLKQDGCIDYDVFTSATRPDVLMICETWRDDQALADHAASEPFAKYAVVLHNAGAMKVEKFIFNP